MGQLSLAEPVPVAIYLAFNAGGSGARGWGAAMSTDTAFLLGVLSLLTPGGTRLRVRLLTLALCDDLAALVVIATVYSSRVSLIPLAVAVGLLAALGALRYAPRAWRPRTAAVLGLPIWVALYESGIDPVIAGCGTSCATRDPWAWRQAASRPNSVTGPTPSTLPRMWPARMQAGSPAFRASSSTASAITALMTSAA